MLLANTVVAFSKRKYVVVVVVAADDNVDVDFADAPLLVRFTVIFPNLVVVVAVDGTTAVPVVCRFFTARAKFKLPACVFVLTLTICVGALTCVDVDNERVDPEWDEEAEDDESSAFGAPVLDTRSELDDVAATVESDEAEAEAVSAATDEADGLRMTSIDCDFSSRLSVCNTNGALLERLLLLLLA